MALFYVIAYQLVSQAGNGGEGAADGALDRVSGAFRAFLFNHVTREAWVMENSDYLLAGLLILLIALPITVIVVVKTRSPGKLRVPGREVSPKEALKAAKQAIKTGNYLRAGELFEAGEKYDKAIECYQKVNAFSKAAQVYTRRLNAPDRGLALLEQYSLWEQAGDLLAAQGQHREAALRYQKAGKDEPAAEHFEKAHEFKLAAELYKKREAYLDAARCYGQNKDWLPAGEMLEQVFREQRKLGGPNPAGAARDKIQELGKKAAYSFKQGGQIGRAAEVLLEAGLGKYAAELFVQNNEPGRAAEVFYQEKEFRRAAEFFDKSGNRKRAAEVMAQFYQSEGRNEEAAKYMVMAENYLEAADLYSGAEDYEKAAKLYLKGGDSRAASEMFILAGRTDLAVGVYEQVGDMAAAIRLCEESGDPNALAGLYERTGKYYEAGANYQERGLNDKAVEVFQKVPTDHPFFADVQYRLGLLYMAKGEFQTALDKLQAMAQRFPLAQNTLEFYYLLAQAYERVEQHMHAYTVYHNILAFDYYFKDVLMRMNMLYQRMQSLGQNNAATMAAGGAGTTGRTMASRYKIVKELGHGGMGVVYLAEDTHLGRNVAFKCMLEEFTANKTMVQSFVSEARNLAKLSHPYIVSLFDAGEEGGVYYIIMEFIEGNDLKKMLEGGKVLSVPMATTVFLQLAQALEAADKLSIIHRDIKPANIMWTSQNIIKVMDFGLAKVVDKMREGRTVIAGTPYYMSPEQNLGRNVDHRSDIYSMGVTMYELLAGRVPFKDGDIGYHHIHTPPPPPSQFNKKVPPPLEKIILRCLAKDQAQRYQSAHDVIADLVAFSQGKKA